MGCTFSVRSGACLITTFFVFSLCCGSLLAAEPIVVPSSVDPGQLEKQFQAPVRMDPAPRLAVPQAPSQVQPKNARNIRFVLDAVEVTDNTVFDDAALSVFYTDLLGKEVTLATVYSVADKMTTHYRNAGYVLSQAIVPAQQIDQGTVVIRLIEGFVDQVRFAQEKPDTDILSAYGAEIRSEKPLTAENLEHYMLLMNDLPGLVAQSTIAASETTLGAADLLVSTTHDDVYGTIALDNRGTQSVGPVQLDLSANYNFNRGRHNQVGVRVVTTPGSNELNLATVSGNVGVGEQGDRVLLSGTGVQSAPDLDAPLNDLESSSYSLEALYSHPVRRGRLSNVRMTGGFRAYNGKTQGAKSSTGQYQIDTKDKIRQIKLGLSVDHVDRHYGIVQMQLGIAQGISGLGSSDNGDSNLSRRDGRVDFTKFTLAFSRLQSLSTDWSLLGALSAQASLDPLLSSEQFGLGGAGFVRAYDGSEKVGDSGIAAKLELRYNTLPLGESGLISTPYAFYDMGAVRRQGGNADDQGTGDRLHAVGAGLRLSYRKFGGYVEVANPRSGAVAAEDNDKIRVFAGVSYNY